MASQPLKRANSTTKLKKNKRQKEIYHDPEPFYIEESSKNNFQKVYGLSSPPEVDHSQVKNAHRANEEEVVMKEKDF